MKREPGKLEMILTLLAFVIAVYPDAIQPRVWWYLTMRASREGARRCGQVAIVAEQHYRQEVA